MWTGFTVHVRRTGITVYKWIYSGSALYMYRFAFERRFANLLSAQNKVYFRITRCFGCEIGLLLWKVIIIRMCDFPCKP